MSNTTMSNTVEAESNHWRSTRKGVVWMSRLVSYVIYVWVIAAEAILALGFVLLLFGANPSSGFAEWAYRNLDRTMKPFRGIFDPIELGQTGNDVGAVFDTSVLFAMIVYGVLLIAMSSLIGWLSHRLYLLERQEQQEQLGRTADQLAYAARVAAVESMTLTPESWEAGRQIPRPPLT
jgi:hypothetical protein